MKNKNNKEQLIEELMNEEMSFQEAQELSSIAENLSGLKQIRLSDFSKNEFLRKLENDNARSRQVYSRWMYMPAMFMTLVILVLCTNTVVEAQASIPGDTLYPLKRLTESIAVKVDPDFNNKIVERRSEEIKKLVETKKDNSLVDTTIHDYESHLDTVEKIDPSQVNESKKNLEEAKSKTKDNQKKKIEQLLLRIEEKKKDHATKSAELTPTKGEGIRSTPGNREQEKDR